MLPLQFLSRFSSRSPFLSSLVWYSLFHKPTTKPLSLLLCFCLIFNFVLKFFLRTNAHWHILSFCTHELLQIFFLLQRSLKGVFFLKPTNSHRFLFLIPTNTYRIFFLILANSQRIFFSNFQTLEGLFFLSHRLRYHDKNSLKILFLFSNIGINLNYYYNITIIYIVNS